MRTTSDLYIAEVFPVQASSEAWSILWKMVGSLNQDIGDASTSSGR